MIDLKTKDKDNVNETRKKEFEKKLSFVNRILPKRGHKTWKYNTKTNELAECEFTEDSKDISWSKALSKDYKRKNKKVIIEDNCIYFNSLNKKNAAKILKRDYSIEYDWVNK
tara:strand:+ start:135 stop:470 length:336 start_codon:yes stop_codon:yes gene_type:complete